MKQKKYIIALAYIFFPFVLSAQYLTSVKLSQYEDSIQVIVAAEFTLGSGETCVPPFVGYNVEAEENNVLIDLYYDLSGAWPAHFSRRKDTFSFFNLLPYSEYGFVFNAHKILDGDTTFNVSTKVIENYLLSIQNCIIDNQKSFKLYPNPSNGTFLIHNDDNIPIKELIIYDLYGREVSFSIIGNKAIIHNPLPGYYIVRINNSKNTPSKKILVR